MILLLGGDSALVQHFNNYLRNDFEEKKKGFKMMECAQLNSSKSEGRLKSNANANFREGYRFESQLK